LWESASGSLRNKIFGTPKDIDYLNNFSTYVAKDRIVVFDTETTGVNTKVDDIIQIAGVEIVKGKIGNKIMFYLETEKFINDRASSLKIHKITNQFLDKNAINKKEGLIEFLDFIKDDALLAHNATFDFNILNANLEKIGLEPIYKNKLFCSLKMSKQLYPKLKSYKLGNILQSLNIEGINSHDALDDTNATVNLALKLNDKILELKGE